MKMIRVIILRLTTYLWSVLAKYGLILKVVQNHLSSIYFNPKYMFFVNLVQIGLVVKTLVFVYGHTINTFFENGGP